MRHSLSSALSRSSRHVATRARSPNSTNASTVSRYLARQRAGQLVPAALLDDRARGAGRETRVAANSSRLRGIRSVPSSRAQVAGRIAARRRFPRGAAATPRTCSVVVLGAPPLPSRSGGATPPSEDCPDERRQGTRCSSYVLGRCGMMPSALPTLAKASSANCSSSRVCVAVTMVRTRA